MVNAGGSHHVRGADRGDHHHLDQERGDITILALAAEPTAARRTLSIVDLGAQVRRAHQYQRRRRTCRERLAREAREALEEAGQLTLDLAPDSEARP